MAAGPGLPQPETLPDGSMLRVVRDTDPPWDWYPFPPVLVFHGWRHEGRFPPALWPARLPPGLPDGPGRHPGGWAGLGDTEIGFLAPGTAAELEVDGPEGRTRAREELEEEMKWLLQDRPEDPAQAAAWLDRVKVLYCRAGIPAERFSVGNEENGLCECLLVAMPDWLEDFLGLDPEEVHGRDGGPLAGERDLSRLFLESYLAGEVWSVELETADGEKIRRSPPVYGLREELDSVFKHEVELARDRAARMSPERTVEP